MSESKKESVEDSTTFSKSVLNTAKSFD